MDVGKIISESCTSAHEVFGWSPVARSCVEYIVAKANVCILKAEIAESKLSAGVAGGSSRCAHDVGEDVQRYRVLVGASKFLMDVLENMQAGNLPDSFYIADLVQAQNDVRAALRAIAEGERAAQS